jgi:hypothetical protein
MVKPEKRISNIEGKGRAKTTWKSEIVNIQNGGPSLVSSTTPSIPKEKGTGAIYTLGFCVSNFLRISPASPELGRGRAIFGFRIFHYCPSLPLY